MPVQYVVEAEQHRAALTPLLVISIRLPIAKMGVAYSQMLVEFAVELACRAAPNPRPVTMILRPTASQVSAHIQMPAVYVEEELHCLAAQIHPRAIILTLQIVTMLVAFIPQDATFVQVRLMAAEQ